MGPCGQLHGAWPSLGQTRGRSSAADRLLLSSSGALVPDKAFHLECLLDALQQEGRSLVRWAQPLRLTYMLHAQLLLPCTAKVAQQHASPVSARACCYGRVLSLALCALLWFWLPLQQVRVVSHSLACITLQLTPCQHACAGDKKMAKVYNTDPYRDCFAVTVPKEVGSVPSLQCKPAGSWHADSGGSTSSACRGHLTGNRVFSVHIVQLARL